MNRKIVMIVLIVFIILTVIFVKNIRKPRTVNSDVDNKLEIVSNTKIVFDEKHNVYIIYNEKTGEEIARSYNKEELHIYEIDPEFDPKLPNVDDSY